MGAAWATPFCKFHKNVNIKKLATVQELISLHAIFEEGGLEEMVNTAKPLKIT